MYRILLIDDDEDEAEILQTAITEIDRSTLFNYISNCAEALKLLKQKEMPVPNIILLDISMPQMNGLDCLQEIKRLDHLKNVPVIIYSNSGASLDVSEAMNRGAQVFWKKPNVYLDLVKKLKELIHSVFPLQ
jgi:CheY-like chemotaxis protein